MKHKRPHRTQEERMELCKSVCDMYASQSASIESCCESVGLDAGTFYLWLVKYDDVKELYKKAKETSKEIFWEKLKPYSENALLRLVKGETAIEKRSETGESATGSFSKDVEVTKDILPNAAATIFSMKGLYPDKFVDRLDHTTKGEAINSPFADLPLEKRLKILEILNEGNDTE